MRALALNHGTRQLSVAYLFSKCGEFAFEAAFAVAIVTLTQADLLLIGLVYFFRYLPSAAFSRIGGWLADNSNRKATLISAELLKGLASGVLFLAFAFDYASVPLFIVASMIMTAGDCLYTPTFRAYFPDIVDNEQLPSLNSGLQAIEDCASIIGPLIFALLSITISSGATFLLFSLCLLVSAGWTMTLRTQPKKDTVPFQGIQVFTESIQSVRLLRRSNIPLFTVICCTTLCAMFATSVIRFILPASVIEHFHSDAAVGYVFSLLALGTVAGSFLYERFNKNTSARSVVKYWLLYGCLFFAAALALKLNAYLFLLVLFFTGFVGAFVDISIVTSIQCLSRPDEIGRNFSLYYFTAVIGDAVSGLIASLVFFLVGPATLISMTFMLLIAPLGWNFKRARTETDGAG